MNYIYYDSRLSGRRTQERKQPEAEVSITFSPLTGRIYFSSGAVQRFGLDINRVTFVQDENSPRDLYLFIDNKRGFKVTSYRWSDYVNSKRAVQKALDSFMGDAQEEPVKFKVAEKAEKIDGHRMFKLEVTEAGGEKKGLSAEKIVSLYKSEDFKGRIKTQEVIDAERVYRTI